MKKSLKIGILGLAIAGVLFGVSMTHNKPTQVADGSPPNVNSATA